MAYKGIDKVDDFFMHYGRKGMKRGMNIYNPDYKPIGEKAKAGGPLLPGGATMQPSDSIRPGAKGSMTPFKKDTPSFRTAPKAITPKQGKISELSNKEKTAIMNKVAGSSGEAAAKEQAFRSSQQYSADRAEKKRIAESAKGMQDAYNQLSPDERAVADRLFGVLARTLGIDAKTGQEIGVILTEVAYKAGMKPDELVEMIEGHMSDKDKEEYKNSIADAKMYSNRKKAANEEEQRNAANLEASKQAKTKRDALLEAERKRQMEYASKRK